MVALLKRTLLAGTLAAIFAATPSIAEPKVAPLGDIYESYNDCFAATPASGLSPAALEEAGWIRATMERAGKPVENELLIYGHPDRAPIIMLSAQSGSGVCIVTARVKNIAAIDEFKSAWADALPEPKKDGTIFFFAKGHAVQIATTGSRKKPGIRLVVMTPRETE